MKQLLLILLLLAEPALAQSPSGRVAAVLDDWHRAAALADEPRYFAHFSANAVFIGTDASERWTVTQFREFARPHFQRKTTWDFKPRDRHIDFSKDGKISWFDEMLDTTNLGVCRGSGVLVLDGREWKIAQYNLSIPIPNAMAKDIVTKIGVNGK
ncbi:MAG: hypothetical protein QOJ99_3990 [Bryobacterales bacterium]|jgi:hypothetical protein|nr:hypothetical protein [Bryobacterales bacterium]